MPILQNAKHVYISSSDFRDINGNYYDYGNSAGANRGPTSVPTEHMRVAGNRIPIFDSRARIDGK